MSQNHVEETNPVVESPDQSEIVIAAHEKPVPKIGMMTPDKLIPDMGEIIEGSGVRKKKVVYVGSDSYAPVVWVIRRG